MDHRTKRSYFVYTLVLVSIVVVILYTASYYSGRIEMSIKQLIKEKTIGKSYLDIMSSLNDARVDAADLKLITLLKKHFIKPPSQLPYNLTDPQKRDPSPGQAAFVDKLLNKKTNGFFIECGAASGELHSNTLFLERYRNWTGILIEANPTTYRELRSKNRKAYSLNACLSIDAHPSVATLNFEDTWMWSGNILGREKSIKGGKRFYEKIQCFPLYSILLALGQLKIDYFSLDIEGAEKGVLESIPWDKVDINVLSIEHYFWSGGKRSLIKYMEAKGYTFLKEITAGGADIIVRKKVNLK